MSQGAARRPPEGALTHSTRRGHCACAHLDSPCVCCPSSQQFLCGCVAAPLLRAVPHFPPAIASLRVTQFGHGQSNPTYKVECLLGKGHASHAQGTRRSRVYQFEGVREPKLRVQGVELGNRGSQVVGFRTQCERSHLNAAAALQLQHALSHHAQRSHILLGLDLNPPDSLTLGLSSLLSDCMSNTEPMNLRSEHHNPNPHPYL